MEIRIKFDPEKPKKPPQKPQKQFTIDQLRQIFVENQDFFDSLVKSGYSPEEASRKILEHR